MIIVDEKKYIEEILQSHIKPAKMGIRTLICYIAKYYYDECKDLKPKQYAMFVLGKLKVFDFSLADYQEYKYIKFTSSYCRKLLHGQVNTLLKEIHQVDIPQEELDIINTLDDLREKKILFTLYVLARINMKPNGWVNYAPTDIFTLANVKVSENERYEIIHRLYKKKYIKLNRIVGKHGYYVQLLPLDNIGYSVTDFTNLGKQYVVLYRPDLFICQKCERLVKRKSVKDHKSKYCKKCAGIADKEKAKERMVKIRSKSKTPESLDFTEHN